MVFSIVSISNISVVFGSVGAGRDPTAGIFQKVKIEYDLLNSFAFYKVVYTVGPRWALDNMREPDN